MALFIVLSVFSGLREFSMQFTNELDPDLKVAVVMGKSFFITPNQEKKLNQIQGIESFSKIIEERVLFSFKKKQLVTYLKGVDSNFIKVNGASKKVFTGNWLQKNTYQVVIGYGISSKLSLGLLDFNNDFEVFVPKPGNGTIESEEDAFNKSILIPVGIYNISDDLDSKYVFSDLGLAQELLNYQLNQVTGIEIRIKQNANSKEISSKIETIFNNQVEVKNRAELNSGLYKMLNTENVALYLIFTLVLIIALFNLIGALIMMILDKKSNLKTLFSLGTEISKLRKIFLLQGVLLSFFGGLIGVFLGSIVILVQQKFEIIMISDTMPYPVVFLFENVLIVLFTILLLGFIASFIASNRVSKKLLE